MERKTKIIFGSLLVLVIIGILIAIGVSKYDVLKKDIKTRSSFAKYTLDAEEMMRSCKHGIAQGNNRFGNGFLTLGTTGNTVLSPYSISALMVMVLLATANNTSNEIHRSLLFPCNLRETLEGYSGYSKNLIGKKSFDLRSANRLYVSDTFALKLDFIANSVELFLTAPVSVDFLKDFERTRIKINDWVANQTNDKIQDLLKTETVSPATEAIMVNAVYYKGEWKKKFNSSETVMGNFSISPNDQPHNVSMMQLTDEFMTGDIPEISANVLEVPYSGDQLSMYFLLPSDPNTPLSTLEEHLVSVDNFTKYFSENLESQRTNVAIPKFKLESSNDVSGHLQALGVKEIFTPGLSNFSGMIDSAVSYYPFVSEIVQRVFIEITEEGTEASVATNTHLFRSSFSADVIDFHLNRPFLFILRDKESELNLFIGRIVDPSILV